MLFVQTATDTSNESETTTTTAATTTTMITTPESKSINDDLRLEKITLKNRCAQFLIAKVVLASLFTRMNTFLHSSLFLFIVDCLFFILILLLLICSNVYIQYCLF
jgi:hypothetical protein